MCHKAPYKENAHNIEDSEDINYNHSFRLQIHYKALHKLDCQSLHDREYEPALLTNEDR